jgi:hypothetical protein
VVTHLTTNPPVQCLSTAERTGSSVFIVLWSYVEVGMKTRIYIGRCNVLQDRTCVAPAHRNIHNQSRPTVLCRTANLERSKACTPSLTLDDDDDDHHHRCGAAAGAPIFHDFHASSAHPAINHSTSYTTTTTGLPGTASSPKEQITVYSLSFCWKRLGDQSTPQSLHPQCLGYFWFPQEGHIRLLISSFS